MLVLRKQDQFSLEYTLNYGITTNGFILAWTHCSRVSTGKDTPISSVYYDTQTFEVWL